MGECGRDARLIVLYDRLMMRTRIATYNPGRARLVSHESRFPVGATSQGLVLDWTIGTTLGGQALHTIGGKQLNTLPGRIAVSCPRTYVHWRAVEPEQGGQRDMWHVVHSTFHPRAHWLDWLAYPERAPGLMDVTPEDDSVRDEAVEALLEIHRLARSGKATAMDRALNALERMLLICWEGRKQTGPTIDERVAIAVEHLRASMSKAVTLEELARVSHCSRAHLAMLFKREMGMPAMQFHESIRIDRAMELLRGTIDPIKSIARSVGYGDAQYFNRRFRLFTGMTPGEYRAMGE